MNTSPLSLCSGRNFFLSKSWNSSSDEVSKEPLNQLTWVTFFWFILIKSPLLLLGRARMMKTCWTQMWWFWPGRDRWCEVHFLNLLPWKWKKNCTNFVLCNEQTAWATLGYLNIHSWKWRKSDVAFVLGGVNKRHANGVYL